MAHFQGVGGFQDAWYRVSKVPRLLWGVTQPDMIIRPDSEAVQQIPLTLESSAGVAIFRGTRVLGAMATALGGHVRTISWPRKAVAMAPTRRYA